MPRVYVSIGSNIEPARHVRAAVTELGARYGALHISSVYESAAVGFASDNFYNLVVALDTEENVHQVAAGLREIENRHGRVRQGGGLAARTLDLDLLLYGDLVIDEPGLSLPREEITRYAFVLWPLAELAPELRHPHNGARIADLRLQCDLSQQQLWPIDFRW